MSPLPVSTQSTSRKTKRSAQTPVSATRFAQIAEYLTQHGRSSLVDLNGKEAATIEFKDFTLYISEVDGESLIFFNALGEQLTLDEKDTVFTMFGETESGEVVPMMLVAELQQHMLAYLDWRIATLQKFDI